MVERGEATAEDIDTAMKLGAGVPMGACRYSPQHSSPLCKLIRQAPHRSSGAGRRRFFDLLFSFLVDSLPSGPLHKG